MFGSSRTPRRALTLAVAGSVAILLVGCSSSHGRTAPSTGHSSAEQSTGSTAATLGSTGSTPASSEPTGHGTSSSAGHDVTIDPCTLLHDDDIESIGGSAGVHTPQTGDWGDGCDFGVVSLFVHMSQGQFDSHNGAEAVGDLGNEAWHDPHLHTLRVRVEQQRFILQCKVCKLGEMLTLHSLAQEVIDRLPGR